MSVEQPSQIAAVLAVAMHLPEALRTAAVAPSACTDSDFDDSYLAFLDEQIALEPRGPDWTRRLRRRRAALAPSCGVPLLHAHVTGVYRDFTVYVERESLVVVHWEEYERNE